MSRTNLSRSISALMISTIILFLVTIGGTTYWLSAQLDKRANEDSVRMIAAAIEALEGQLNVTALDYSKWDTAFAAMIEQDPEVIHETYASGATDGTVMQLLALTDGPFDGVQSWEADGSYDPVPDLVPEEVIDAMRRQVSEKEIGDYETRNFSAFANGNLHIFSGTWIEPEDATLHPDLKKEELTLAILGYRLDADELAKMGANFLIEGLTITGEPDAGKPFVALTGPDGAPSAYLAWPVQRPGTALVKKLLIPLSFVAAFFTAAALATTLIARKSAAELIRQEARASLAARTDHLTKLPNRFALGATFEALAEKGMQELSVLFLDVNGFKTVNDTTGHDGGDYLVSQLADRLRSALGAGDMLARVGGDEFLVLTPGEGAAERTQQLGHQIEQSLRMPFLVKGRRFHIGVSMGYAHRDRDDIKPAELVRQADLAMYHAKKRGTSELIEYDSRIETDADERKQIEEALRAAISEPDEFTINYQPIHDAILGEIVKFEALARWTSGIIGPIRPDLFISVAEETGLIVEVGEILFKKICTDLQNHPDLRVSINISPAQLENANFTKNIIGTLKEANVSASRIEIELTESIVVESPELAAFKLDMLKEAGFSTSLDDFGTGYSSIEYLRRLPFDTLKIDKSFIDKFPGCKQDHSLVQAIVILGHALNQKIVCEGVETEEQMRALQSLGCDQLQGYYFSKPMPIGDLPDYVAQSHFQKFADEATISNLSAMPRGSA